MKKTHESATYDKWHREGMKASIDVRFVILIEKAKTRLGTTIQAMTVARKVAYAD